MVLSILLTNSWAVSLAQVEMFYGGIAADILIAKGILSNPMDLKALSSDPGKETSKPVNASAVCVEKAFLHED